MIIASNNGRERERRQFIITMKKSEKERVNSKNFEGEGFKKVKEENQKGNKV